jgi:alkylated DNA repair dioxygenase AlkB
MSSGCGALQDRDINLGIHEYVGRQVAAQKAARSLAVPITLGGLQEHIAKKYACSPAEVPSLERIEQLARKIISLSNAHAKTVAKGGPAQEISIQAETFRVTVTPPAPTMRPTAAPFVPMQPGMLNVPKPTAGRPRASPGSRLPQDPVRHDYVFPKVPGGPILKPTTMTPFYSYQGSPKSGKIDCSKEQKCPEHFVCDVDRNKCLSQDFLPADYSIPFQGKMITGSGRTLVEYLVAHGVSLEDIRRHKIPETYYMQDYLAFLDAVEGPLPAVATTPPGSGGEDEEPTLEPAGPPPADAPPAHLSVHDLLALQPRRLTTFRDLPVSPAGVLQVPGGMTISTRGWPAGITVIPDFLRPEAQARLYTYINSLSWEQPEVLARSKKLERATQQYGYTYDYTSRGGKGAEKLELVNDPPGMIACLADLLYSHGFIPTPPNQIIINRYLPGEGISKHTDSPKFEDTILSISLNSPAIMTFEKGGVKVDIPLTPGSLLKMSNGARLDWTHAIASRKSDEYLIPGLPPQKWIRGTRISVTLRTVKPEYRGEDVRASASRT